MSVREAISSKYDDRRPKFREDGTWSYEYYQENLNLEAVRRNYANIALNECIKDRIPVGVMRQTEARPNSKYLILGVALVVRWNEGYYLLEGFSQEGSSLGAQVYAWSGIDRRRPQAGQYGRSTCEAK